ncbi:MAG: FHA domain-containing protein [Planctomycetales bacterium]|nr:FHA domain-containing protein [Planctomycetales bacterium]
MTHVTEDEQIIETTAEPLQQYLKVQAGVGANGVKSPKPTRTLPFRPLNRQPLALLTILDDGSREEGETIRIRDSKFSIGREKGNLTIPFDSDMSGQHVELCCQKLKGRFRWYLIDRKSTNGTFVRGMRASLFRDTELLLGSRRYLFRLPSASHALQETQGLQTQSYRAPQRTMLEQFVPQLSEVGVRDEEPVSFALGGSEMLLGSDSRCELSIEHDPFISPKHARFFQDEQQRWRIEDQKSLNGVWIRVNKFAMDKPTEFQLGQQRFRFQPSIA